MFTCITGLDFQASFLEKVMELDRLVYSPKYAGELANMVARYEKNPDTFFCIMDKDADRLAGYINFFPCMPSLYQDIVSDCPTIRDDDITPEEIALYQTEENHLFVISIVIHPDYRKTKDAIVALTDGWIAYLNAIQDRGYPITDITATAVSSDGKKCLRNLLFHQLRTLTDGNVVYSCEDKFLEKLLKHELYFKSYRDDIYLLLPFADNKKNQRMNDIFGWEDKHSHSGMFMRGKPLYPGQVKAAAPTEVPDIPAALIEGLNDCLTYECDNTVVEELETRYLGAFSFLHSTDDYLPEGEEVVIGEETAYAILTAHAPTHMYVLTLLLPDCAYSTTQVEDQLSYGYLKIRDPKDPSHFIDLYEYLRQTYGLLKCGDGKCLLCMSEKPAQPMEFQNILSGEVYNSMHIDYHIKSPQIEEQCEKNYAQYDYYEVYLSDMVIAFILKEFSDNVFDRIAITATYAFIAELVMFQNISLAKTNIKISNALAGSGDLSHEDVLDFYQEFGMTIRFWEKRNFKYRGTQAEAACITTAFENKELREAYYEHQEFLEHIVDLKSARMEARNGMILNIVATVLALIQIQSFAVDLLSSLYQYLGIAPSYAAHTFNTGIFGGTFTVILIYLILRRRSRHKKK